MAPIVRAISPSVSFSIPISDIAEHAKNGVVLIEPGFPHHCSVLDTGHLRRSLDIAPRLLRPRLLQGIRRWSENGRRCRRTARPARQARTLRVASRPGELSRPPRESSAGAAGSRYAGTREENCTCCRIWSRSRIEGLRIPDDDRACRDVPEPLCLPADQTGDPAGRVQERQAVHEAKQVADHYLAESKRQPLSIHDAQAGGASCRWSGRASATPPQSRTPGK